MIAKYLPDSSHPYNYQRAAHLLRRTVTGPTHKEINDSVSIGYEATIQQLLTQFTQSINYIDEWADKDPQVVRPVSDEEYVGWFWVHKRRVEMFYQWWLQSIVHSPISIQERMVLF